MDKDKIKELIDLKAERVAKAKIEELRKLLEKNFPYELHSVIFNSVGFWENKSNPEAVKLKTLFFEKEREIQQIDFFNKIESVFYNMQN